MKFLKIFSIIDDKHQNSILIFLDIKIEQIEIVDEFLIEIIKKINNQSMYNDHYNENKTFFINTKFNVRK